MKKEKTALLELHYLPSIQYITKLMMYSEIYFEQKEHYQKGSYRNRSHIVGANGLMRLSIPLKSGKNSQMPIRDVKISYSENWQNQHWNSIKSAYGNAPFFEYYADDIADLFKDKENFLFDLNKKIIDKFISLIPINTSIKMTDSYADEKTNQNIDDLRSTIRPKSKAQLNDPFFEPIPYPQIFEEKHGFIPNLSILDLLFCTGPQAILILESSIKL